MKKVSKGLSIFLIVALLLICIPLIASAGNSFEMFSEDGYDVEFKIISDWGSGFNGQITLINTGEKTIENWSLAFDFDREISNFWSADIVAHEGTRYVIKNKGWNADIAVGQKWRLDLEEILAM